MELFRSFEEAVQRIGDYVEHYNHVRCHQGIGGFTPADRYFGIAQAVERALRERREARGKGEALQIGRMPLLYLVGKFTGRDLRVQEGGGRVQVFLDERLVQTLDFTAGLAAVVGHNAGRVKHRREATDLIRVWYRRPYTQFRF